MVGWLATGALLLRVFVIGLPLAVAFVIVSALSYGLIEDDSLRALVGLAVCVGLPLLIRWRAGRWLHRRGRKAPLPSRGLFLALGNVVIASTLAFGFADDVGRALRRHGDWFLGERDGAVARTVRDTIGFAALHLETFDRRPELDPLVLPPPAAVIRPPELDPQEPFSPIQPPEPIVVAWYHPLAGPERWLPTNSSRRFGASRPQPRPAECELGHCGVDIGTTIGQPVFAVFDGVVDSIQRNPDADLKSGIFIILSHKDKTVRSRYIHLDSVAAGLKVGDPVKGGQLIGRLGSTGIFHSTPHLHFGLSLFENGHDHYIDPEPYLREWQLIDPATAASMIADAGGRGGARFR